MKNSLANSTESSKTDKDIKNERLVKKIGSFDQKLKSSSVVVAP